MIFDRNLLLFLLSPTPQEIWIVDRSLLYGLGTNCEEKVTPSTSSLDWIKGRVYDMERGILCPIFAVLDTSCSKSQPGTKYDAILSSGMYATYYAPCKSADPSYEYRAKHFFSLETGCC